MRELRLRSRQVHVLLIGALPVTVADPAADEASTRREALEQAMLAEQLVADAAEARARRLLSDYTRAGHDICELSPALSRWLLGKLELQCPAVSAAPAAPASPQVPTTPSAMADDEGDGSDDEALAAVADAAMHARGYVRGDRYEGMETPPIRRVHRERSSGGELSLELRSAGPPRKARSIVTESSVSSFGGFADEEDLLWEEITMF